MPKSGPEVIAFRYRVMKNNQVEGVELVRDDEHPDGVLTVEKYKVTPRLPGTHRPWGTITRIQDEQIPVKIRPTGKILLKEATVEAVNFVINQWGDFGPLQEESS